MFPGIYKRIKYKVNLKGANIHTEILCEHLEFEAKIFLSKAFSWEIHPSYGLSTWFALTSQKVTFPH